MRKVITYTDMNELKTKLDAQEGLIGVVHIENGQALLDVADLTPSLSAVVELRKPDGRTKTTTRSISGEEIKYEHEGKEITDEEFEEDEKSFKKRKAEAAEKEPAAEEPAAPAAGEGEVRGED